MTTTTDYAAKEASRAFTSAQLQAANPHLTPAGNNSLIAATKNIRTELKRAFPKIKFSITSSRYSGGDSISVRWMDGPTTRQVEEFADKYRSGNFDSSHDLYIYSDDAWARAFGDAKYILCGRKVSDAFLSSIFARINRKYGTAITVEMYRTGKTWHLYSPGGCDMGHVISEAISKHTCAITKGTQK